MSLSNRVAGLEKAIHKLEQANNARVPEKPVGHPIPIANTENKRPWYGTLIGWKTVAELVAIPFAIGYAIITYREWRDLQTHYRIEQRAWVKAVVTWSSFPATNEATVQISNVGKSVATGPTAVAIMEIVNAGSGPSLVWRYKPHQSDQFSLDFPGDVEQPFSVPLLAADEKPLRLTATQTKDLAEGKAYMVVSGLVAYGDQFGKHWTRFCSWQAFSKDRADYESKSCVMWNAIGDGEPPQ